MFNYCHPVGITRHADQKKRGRHCGHPPVKNQSGSFDLLGGELRVGCGLQARLAEQISAELASGLIDTGVDLATGETK